MKSRLLAVALTGAVILLSAEQARAADLDIDHLPVPDSQSLSSSITTWTDDTTLRYSITSWTDDTTFKYSTTTWNLDYAVEDLEETTQDSGQTVVTLDADILFEFGKAALPTAAQARIGKAVAKAPRNSAVSIGGHTDDVGTTAANLKLSQARAKAVAGAVKTARPDLVLTVTGFGESKPVASNSDAAKRSKNRRVEIRFST